MEKRKVVRVKSSNIGCFDCVYFDLKDCSKIKRQPCMDNEHSYIFIEAKDEKDYKFKRQAGSRV